MAASYAFVMFFVVLETCMTLGLATSMIVNKIVIRLVLSSLLFAVS